MRKTKISKRWLSVIMALLMVVTSIPLVALPITSEAAVSWTPIASSDFSSVNSVSQDTAFTPSTYNGMGNTMTWTPHAWTGNGDPYVDGANGAVAIPDGYMYLSGYSGGSVPITGNGSKGWKLDFGFRFNTDDSDNDNYESSDNYCFLKMFVFDGDLTNPARKNAAYCYFCQNANGVGYSWEDDGHNVGTQSLGTSITTNNGNLVKDTNYHYIAEYTVNRFRTYITDDAGTIVQLIIDTTESTFLSRLGNISTTTVGSIKIGDDDNNYYFKGLEYRNITFYSGTSVDDASTAAHPNNANDKYVMAYFTGNYNLDNESLRYAVSDDGINFHTLNKGMPVTEINIPETGEGLTVYPTGASMTGAWSTGHVRDPYILRKQDGSGFYILATDLDTGTNGFNLNSKLLVWEVEKLEDVTTTQPWAIDVCSLIGSYTRRAWAPEAFYDAAKGKYFLHFSIKADGVYDNGTFLYGIYTSDFQSFDGTPKRLINTGADNIDASINYNSADNLYYMWYKNESNSKLNYATSVNADGPYINQASFDYSLGVEGPEVFRNLANNGWIFLCDAFGESADPATSKQGVFQAFTSSSISGFDTNSPVSTNIPYLYARHAGVARITNDEYNALISAYGPIADNNTADEFYFTGNTSASGGGWLGSVKDPSEHVFKIHRGDSGSYSAAAGVLTLNGANAFMQDDTVRTKLKGNEFTVSFKSTITDSSNLSSAIPIAAVGNINKDYIRVNTNSTLYVNGATVDFSDDLTFEANTEYDIKISYNGATASLFVDGEFITSAVMDEKVVDPNGAQCYLALGWSDTCGTGRISATYKDLVITATSEDTRNTDDAAMEDYIDNSNIETAVNNMSAVSTNGVTPTIGANNSNSSNDTVVNYNNTIYYRNILYYEDARNDYKLYGTWGKGNTWTSDQKQIMHIYYPTATVLYDGNSTPVLPVALGTKASGGGNVYPTQAYITTSDFTMKANYWYGYSDHIGWYSTDTTGNSISALSGTVHGTYNGKDNTNTTRSWSNAIEYTGTPTETLTEITTTSWHFRVDTSSYDNQSADSNGYQGDLTSSSNSSDDTYMPIRIIDVTELNTIIDEIQEAGSAYNTIIANNNYYTPASTVAYISAVKAITNFNLNTYFNGANNYQACADDIDALVDNYDTAVAGLVRQYLVNYNYSNGTTVEHYYFAEGTTAAVVGGHAPAFQPAYFDETGHYTFTEWDEDFADVTADATYTQVKTTTAHDYSYVSNNDGTHTGSCDVNGEAHQINAACTYNNVRINPAESGEDHSYFVNKCSVCGYEDPATKVYIYTVTFKDEDGTVLSGPTEYAAGATPTVPADPTKAATAQYTYTFAGWDNAVADVTGDAVYTATYSSTVNKYTVKFLNEDGTELQNTQVEYGTVPAYTGATPAKEADAQYTYTFAGWDNDIVAVTGDATYTAQFTNNLRQYVILFKNYDGATLQDTPFYYGTTPVYSGALPVKAADAQYTYTFAGWDNDIATVTGDATYTATYSSTVNKYAITFADVNDGTIKTENLDYGTTAEGVAAVAPTEFTGEVEHDATNHYTYGWDADFAEVTGPATYTREVKSTTAHSFGTYVTDNNGHHVANCTVSGCDITDTVNCTYENVYHAVSGVNNGYTVPTCTVCGYEDMANAVYDETDWTAYTACLGVVEANLANTVKYSAASLTAYKNATDAIKATVTVGDQTKTQAFIDSKTAALTEAASLLELHSYTITFVKNVDGIETSSDIVANYGELVNLNYNGEGKVYKWTNNFTGVERTINVNTADYGVVVNGDATYTVYAATAAAEPAADTSKVSVIGKDRAVADMAYLENGTYDVSINGNAITIGDATLTAPVLFFYNVTGFTVNGEAIGESITINGDVDIKAVYTAKPAASMTITYTGCKNAETNVSGGPIDSAWDELITVTADGATKDTEWLINDKVVGYGETFTFRMTQTAVVTCRNGEEKAVAAINYMAYDSTRMVSKIVASYDLPEGATYISGGIINKNDTTAGATVENNKVTYEYLMASVGTSAQKVARTQTSDSQQFVFDISRKTDISFVTGAIAFVTYELGGEEYTVYSTEVSYMAYTKA